MQWLRLYHDTPNDPKWRIVALRSKQPVGNVLAVWMQMLICASEAEPRGTLAGWNDEISAIVLGYEPEVVTSIRRAMQGLVLDGDTLTGWDKRQRASDNVAERVKRHRTKAKDTPPDGGSTNGTGKHRNATNGKGNGDVTLQERNCTDFSLDLSYLPSNPTTLIKDGGGGAGAHEVAVRVSGLTGLPATGRNLATVEAWLSAGYDPERDIYPAVAAVVASAKDEIGCFRYFTKAIKRFRDERTAPPLPDNVSYLPRAAGGRRGDPGMSSGARDLLAAYHDPNFTYGVGR